MSIIDYILIIIAVSIIALAVVILLKKRHLREANQLSFFILFSGFWILSVNVAMYSLSAPMVVFWTRTSYFIGSSAIIFFLFFVFVFRFPNKKILQNSKLILLLFIILATLNFILPDNMIYANVKIVPNEPSQGEYGNFYLSFILFVVYVFVKSIITLFKGYRGLSVRKKMQIKYVILGATLSIFGAIIFDVVLPILGDERFYNIGTAFFVFFIGFTSYAIIKHQLLDIKVIIQRSIVYSIVLATIVAFYLLILFVFQFFFRATSETTIVGCIITIIVGIYGVPVIEKYFRRKTDKIFFKDKYDYSEAVFELSEVLNKNINLEILLRQVTSKLKEILKTGKIDIIFPDQNLIFDGNDTLRKSGEKLPPYLIETIKKADNSIMVLSEIPYLLAQADNKTDPSYKKTLEAAMFYAKKHNIELAVSIMSGDKIIGLIILSGKLSEEAYSAEDINLLKTFSHQAAVALEKSQLYEKVKKHSEQLEIMVEKRTSKLLDLQEEQKQMMLEIAHGLQTPLTIIKGKLEMLSGNKEEKKEFKSLEQTIDRVSRFIYDILRLANLKTADKQAEMKKLNLSEILEELIENFTIITSDKDITIEHDIAPGISIRGDKGEIEELVMNIVSNSLKYMRPGIKGIVNISLNRDSSLIKLVIRDNGVGINKEYIPHLFTKFYRVKDAAHEKKKGTGLGLVICKRITEKHGGTIHVESEQGKGAKIIIKLPGKIK